MSQETKFLGWAVLIIFGSFMNLTAEKPVLVVNDLGLEFTGQTNLTFTDKYGFLADETGLYRFEGRLEAQTRLHPLSLTDIENTTYFPESLQYVDGRLFFSIRTLKALELYSDDDGETFKQLPEIQFKGTQTDGTIYSRRYYRSKIFKYNGLYYTRPYPGLGFTEFGTYLAWSDDKGLTWELVGDLEADKEDNFLRTQLAGVGILVDGVLMTGEYFNQMGYAPISRGVLAPDGKSWEVPPEVGIYPPNDCFGGYTEGLNVESFNYDTSSKAIIMIRWGILKSTDKGETFHYVFRYWSLPECQSMCTNCEDYSVLVGLADREDGNHEPFTSWIAFVRRDKNILFSGGNWYSPELCVSYDGGNSWYNYTDAVSSFPGFEWIVEDPFERLLAGFKEYDSDRFVIGEIVYHDNLEQLLPGSWYYGGGWRQSSSFGWIVQSHMPWIWMEDYGQWVWIKGDDPENVYLWNPEDHWMWTAETVFPTVYFYDSSNFGTFK